LKQSKEFSKRMTKLIIFLNLFLLLIYSDILAQNKIQERWEFSIGGGISFPVGVYSKKNPAESVIINYLTLNPSSSLKQYVGFAKDKSGFAKLGPDYNLEIKYSLNTDLSVKVIAGCFTNPVEAPVISDYLTKLGGETKMEESPYRIIYLAPGFEYQRQLNKISLGLSFNAGYSLTNFPYYKFVYLFTTTVPYIFFGNVGPRPDLRSLTMGAGLSITYNLGKRMKIGLNAIYQRSNFPYHMSNQLTPGSGAWYEIDDILKVRVFNTAIKLDYTF